MAPDDRAARLRRLISRGKESGFVLFDEVEAVLPPKHNGGRALEETILAIENSGLEILDEPRAEVEAKLSVDTDPESFIDDPVKVYVREVCQVPLLSRLHEFELAQLMQSADPEAAQSARKDLVEGNLRVVVAIAKRYADSGVHVLDLTQAGNQGLMSAIRRFDCRRGCRFSSYAIWWIRQSIIRAARVH